MPVDASGKYQMNPNMAKSVPDATGDSSGGMITIDPATMTMTTGGQSTPYDSPQALCEALEAQLGGSEEPTRLEAGQ